MNMMSRTLRQIRSRCLTTPLIQCRLSSASKVKKPKKKSSSKPLGLPTPSKTKFASFNKRMLMLGFGSIGEGTLPLILKHIDIPRENITILTAPDRAEAALAAAKEYGVSVEIAKIERENYGEILSKQLSAGDFLVNLSVEIDSPCLYEFCAERNVLYIDTVVDCWGDLYDDYSVPQSERTNYAMREMAMTCKRKYGPNATTAVIAHGANPGLVSHFMKAGLINLALDQGREFDEPSNRREWGELARDVGVRTMHISERDTSICKDPKKKSEFVNTWSVDGFMFEGSQPAEMSWGTHEKELPEDGRVHDYGSQGAIFLNATGLETQVRTWAPMAGTFRGMLVTHNEAISIGDYLTLRDEVDQVTYRPTVHYAYHPCNDAIMSVHEFVGNNYKMDMVHRLIVDEIVSGVDELGVLFGGSNKTYWYGSQLEVTQCREWIEKNSPTTLQVTATVLGGIVWAIDNPRRGIVEAEEMDYKTILNIAQPYVEPVVGEYTDWNPLVGRSDLFSEAVDFDDPWQFKNVRCNMRSPVALGRTEQKMAVQKEKFYL